MGKRTVIIVAAALLVVGVATALAIQTWGRGANTPPSDYHVRVVQDGKELASFDLAALEAIGMKTVVAQGREQNGPTLLAVLKKAGVKDGFTQVTIIGSGMRDSGDLVLQRSAIGEDIVLSVAPKRSTVKLAGPTVPEDMRVRDVTELIVQ